MTNLNLELEVFHWLNILHQLQKKEMSVGTVMFMAPEVIMCEIKTYGLPVNVSLLTFF